MAPDDIDVSIPGHADSADFINRLQRIVDAFRVTHILIAGDMNAHSPAWGGDVFDGRGSLLEEFFTHNDLLIINNPLSPPTFTSHRGESWIDVAVGCNSTYTKISNWRVLTEDSLTEHALITFGFSNSDDAQDPAYVPPLKYALNRANWLEMKDYLETHLISQYSENRNETCQQIDNNINTILYCPQMKSYVKETGRKLEIRLK
ncbi:uncharacterized protein [Centruroides vittatus]|uniref:uncharacterized protein n=1 Tax=Centruroides vittatus TaxID=120091 RepID=UPI0035107C79